MIGMRAESMIAAIKDIVLPTSCYDFSRKSQKGILFGLDYRVRNYHETPEENYEFGASQDIVVLIAAPHSVFIAEPTDNIFDLTKIPFDQWENTSNHDSCWRSDGLSRLSSTYFRLCNEINTQRADAGFEEIAPVTMSHNVFPMLCRPLWREVTVETVADGDYRRKIVYLA